MAEASDTSTGSSSRKNSDSVGIGMRTTIKLIRTKYSKVKDITTETLEGWLHGDSDRNIVLMDCRDKCEYGVSHLAGAQQVDWENSDPQELLGSIPQDKPSTIVCYCSVGYRSAAVADKLQKCLHSSDKGCTQDIQVFNLAGSIFKWANEGRAMIDPEGQPITLCHPYSAVWGKMLNKELRFSGNSSGE